MYYLNYFFLYSIIGHIIETILGYNSGILYGYWTPVYGIGVVIILFLFNKFKEKNLSNLKIAFLLFIFSFLFLTIIEWIGGILIEKIFNKVFWNYSKLSLNIGKYIAIEISLIWSIGSLIITFVLKKYTDIIINKIPKFITLILSILFIIDLICTILFKVFF